MPALLTLVIYADSEDPDMLQACADALRERAEQGLELEEQFQEEESPFRILGSTWLVV